MFAWLFESDPDNLQQALAREFVLNREFAAAPHSSSKVKEDYRLLLRNESDQDELEQPLLVSRLLERFREYLTGSPSAEE